MTKTSKKQTAASKSFEACLRGMAVGEQRKFRRRDTVLTFIRNEHGVTHHFGDGSKHYVRSFRDAANWFTEDDGKGAWSLVTDA